MAFFCGILLLPEKKAIFFSILQSSRGVLRNFTKFTGKHLRQILLFNKVASLRPEASTILKKETLAQVLSCEFCKISKNSFSYRTPWVATSDP